MFPDATQLYDAMADEVRDSGRSRRVRDSASPTPGLVYEAQPGRVFALAEPTRNVVGSRSVDLRWAVANVLYFFSGTEDAEVLLQYNRHACKYLCNGIWHGAYGAVAMPQVHECVSILRGDLGSRRAVVSMGDCLTRDINRPACWSLLHFLMCDRLELLVYQRSLSLSVAPYDCVLLCGVLLHVAAELGQQPGALRWCIGSLHASAVPPQPEHRPVPSVVLPLELTRSSALCSAALCDPSLLSEPYSGYMRKEART